MANRIPMSPSEIPPQGYRLEIPLPSRPTGFVSFDYFSSPRKELVPAKMPHSASHLAQLEWAWSPMNNAIASFDISLNKTRTHWIVWLGFFNDGDLPWHWDREPLLLAEKGTVSREEACIFLLEDALAWLRDFNGYDHFHWINNGGVVRVHRIELIGDRVWSE